jgi:hypothetical protein
MVLARPLETHSCGFPALAFSAAPVLHANLALKDATLAMTNCRRFVARLD